MSALAVVEHLLAAGTIDPTAVDKYFGSRIHHLMRSPAIRQYLIEEPDDRWDSFIHVASSLGEREGMADWVNAVSNEREMASRKGGN